MAPSGPTYCGNAITPTLDGRWGFLRATYWSGHPENYLFSLSKKKDSGSKYPEDVSIHFETKALIAA